MLTRKRIEETEKRAEVDLRYFWRHRGRIPEYRVQLYVAIFAIHHARKLLAETKRVDCKRCHGTGCAGIFKRASSRVLGMIHRHPQGTHKKDDYCRCSGCNGQGTKTIPRYT